MRRKVHSFTRRGSAAHAPLVDVLDFQANEPGTEGDVFIGILVQYGSEN